MQETTVVEVEETVEVVAPERTKTFYELRRVRKGKTKRDHESGAWRKRLTNLEERANWIRSTRATQGTPPPMPYAHGLGNGSKRNKIKPGRASKV